MAEDRIDSYVDRTGVKGDTDYIVAALNEVYTAFKKVDSVKIDLKGISGLAGLAPVLNQAKAGVDSLAVATETVTKRMAQMNGSSKEFTQVLLTQVKAQKEAAQAALAEAKAANESAKAKTTEAKASEQSAKAKEAEKKLIEQATNDYLQLSKAYNEAALKAKNYFVTLGEASPVTQQAIKDASDIGNVLKKADAAVGQFQRNVGNYKSAFDGLGFSFAQLGRELPSLAISLQTFALAISNNLPIVVDEIGKAKKEIAALKAEGKDAPSLFQRIGKSIFSLQTLLSVGITLFTLFASKLFGAGNAAKKTQKAVDDLNASFEKQKDLINDLNRVFDDYTQLDIERLKQKGATDKQIFDTEIAGLERNNLTRVRLRDQLNTELQQLERKQTTFELLSRDSRIAKAIKDEKAKNEALLAETKKNIAETTAEIDAGDRQILIRRAQFDNEQLEKAKQAAKDRADKAKDAAKDAKQAADAELTAEFEILQLTLQRTIDFNKEIADNEEKGQFERLAAFRKYYETQKQLIEINALVQAQLGTKTAKELELVEAQKNDALIRLEREFQQGRLEIQREANNQRIADEKRVRDALEKGIDEAYKRFAKSEEERTKKAKTEADKRLKDFEDEAARRKELEQQLATEIRELTFTLFTSGLDREKNAIQEQIDLLEQKKQKDIEVANQTIVNVQERAAAITVIEARAEAQREQLRQRQRQLDIRKAEFDKAASIARIIQETAMNVVKYFGTPLAILAGAIGAIQLAAVIAQPIPRYKHGKNVHDDYEGPAIVGDGGRREAIIREDGSVHITDDRPQLTHVKKRDVILPDANQLAGYVVSGNMGGKLRAAALKEDSTATEIRTMRKDVVKAIKAIPQPIIKTEGVISRRIRRGDNSNDYLNQNLQS